MKAISNLSFFVALMLISSQSPAALTAGVTIMLLLVLESARTFKKDLPKLKSNLRLMRQDFFKLLANIDPNASGFTD